MALKTSVSSSPPHWAILTCFSRTQHFTTNPSEWPCLLLNDFIQLNYAEIWKIRCISTLSKLRQLKTTTNRWIQTLNSSLWSACRDSHSSEYVAWGGFSIIKYHCLIGPLIFRRITPETKDGVCLWPSEHLLSPLAFKKTRSVIVFQQSLAWRINNTNHLISHSTDTFTQSFFS